MSKTHNKALHLTAIPLRFIAVGEICRSTLGESIGGEQRFEIRTQRRVARYG